MTAPRPSPPPAPAHPLGDGAVLADLLRLAGPDLVPDLLRQLDVDLSQVATRLTAALAAQDWPRLRAQSHILIALAGTVGAADLRAAALAVNDAAHARDAAALQRLAATLQPDLAALIDHIRHHPQAPR